MNPKVDAQLVIKKFQRNGHRLSKKGLDKVVQFLSISTSNSKFLDQLVKKVNEMSISSSQSSEETLQQAIMLLQQTEGKFNSFEEVVEEARKWSIYFINPYERAEDKFFQQRPTKDVFEFVAEDKLTISLSKFKAIKEYSRRFEKGGQYFIGVLYQNFDCLYHDSKARLILQNEINEIEIVFSTEYQPNSFLIAGCTYIVHGSYPGRDFIMKVQEFKLPQPLPVPKQSLLRSKFKTMCERISSQKQQLNFQAEDFSRYETIYNEKKEYKPILFFGNVTINVPTMKRIVKICQAYTSGLYCIFIMLSEGKQEEIDLKAELPSVKIFIVPNINSQGPRLLPKLPILKADFKAKIVTNPSRFSIDGKQVLLVNYPLVRELHSKNLRPQEVSEVSQADIARKVTELIFSQNSVGICHDYYWRQSEYLETNADTLIVVSDKASDMFYERSKGKGGLLSTGNFQRDGDFICYSSKDKNPVQFSQEAR